MASSAFRSTGFTEPSPSAFFHDESRSVGKLASGAPVPLSFAVTRSNNDSLCISFTWVMRSKLGSYGFPVDVGLKSFMFRKFSFNPCTSSVVNA